MKPNTITSSIDPLRDAAARRILIVSHYFWPEEFRVNELARDLRDRGHAVTVATGYPNYPGHRVFASFRDRPVSTVTYDGDIAIERFFTIGIGSSAIGLVLNYFSLALAMTLLAPWRLRGRRFDAVVCFQPSPFTIVLPALVLGRLKRAPVVLWVLDCWPETLEAIGIVRNKALLRAVGAVVGYAYRRCAKVLGQSRSFEESIAHWSGRDDLFGHFPNWIEDIFAYDPVPATPSAPVIVTLPFTVVFAGNLGEAQDFPTVVRAMDALRDQRVRWKIVGGGRMENWLREEVVRRGLADRVEMPGRRPVEEMPALFAAADALLVTLDAKPVFAMTVPGKVQSYMAAGRPIVGALDGEGEALIAQAECGFTGPAGDHRALADAIMRLVHAPRAERDRLGGNGRRFAEVYFDRHTVLDKFDQWLQEEIARNRAR